MTLFLDILAGTVLLLAVLSLVGLVIMVFIVSPILILLVGASALLIWAILYLTSRLD